MNHNAMNKNIEIEFKTRISEETYHKLLSDFDLENNVFKQTNYYFDTDNLDLNQRKTVLRIRSKGPHSFKLTLKSQHEQEAYEFHVFLTKDEAEHMIKHGFNTKDYFEEFDYFVTFKTSLDNYRAKTPYKRGTLFFDLCEYCGQRDYEIEYEVDHYEEGLKVWYEFLEKNHITQTPTLRKSERALMCILNK